MTKNEEMITADRAGAVVNLFAGKQQKLALAFLRVAFNAVHQQIMIGNDQHIHPSL